MQYLRRYSLQLLVLLYKQFYTWDCVWLVLGRSFKNIILHIIHNMKNDMHVHYVYQKLTVGEKSKFSCDHGEFDVDECISSNIHAYIHMCICAFMHVHILEKGEAHLIVKFTAVHTLAT